MILRFLLFVLAASYQATATAHPDDEFCEDGGLDPELCAALVELDSATPAARFNSKASASSWDTFARYTGIGVGHILPGGTDHILFVLGLALGVLSARALLWLVTAFTLAHGAAITAAVLGWVSAPSLWVEAGIAATIAWVGIENLVWKPPLPWRYSLVFVFGLVHGLGFAGFLSDIGLPDERLPAALLGFNLGVEAGQITVVVGAAALSWLALRAVPQHKRDSALRWLRIAGSATIALIGIVWTIQRLAAG